MTDGQRHHAALPCGYRLHWYEIESILGQGGFGITYLATDTTLGTKVAIKEFLPTDLAVRTHDSSVQPMSGEHRDTFAWGLSRFLQEARTLAKFQHPNIVRVYSGFEANNTAYMVMEYVEGQTLEDALKFRRVHTEQQLLDILFPLLEGLEKIHGAGFIHRDIKPENIYLRADGSPLLIDFGSARQAVGARTRTLTALVSPGYAPFEQYGAVSEQDKQGPWTDIYSLGATFYRALSGKSPVDAITRAESVMSGTDKLTPASAMGEGRYSKAFLVAIDAALQFLPENRPQTITAWKVLIPKPAEAPERPQSEVETVPAPAPVGSPPAVTSSAQVGSTPPPRTSKSAALLAVLCLGLAGYALWPRLGPLLPWVSEERAAEAARLAAQRQAELTREAARLTTLRAQMEEEQRKFAALQAELDAARKRQAQEAQKLAETQRRAAEDAARMAAIEEQSEEERAASERKSREEAARLQEIKGEMEAENARLATLQAELDAATRDQEEELRKLEEAHRTLEVEREKVVETSAEVTQLARQSEVERERRAQAEARRKEEEGRLATRRAEFAAIERRVAEEQERLAALERERQAAEEARRSAEEEERRLAEERRKAEEQARLAREAREQQEVEKLRALLTGAAADIEARRLTSPAGNNAFEKLTAVLEMDADNADAKRGLQTIVDSYIRLATQAGEVGELDKADVYLERAGGVLPGSESISIAADELKALRAGASPVAHASSGKCAPRLLPPRPQDFPVVPALLYEHPAFKSAPAPRVKRVRTSQTWKTSEGASSETVTSIEYGEADGIVRRVEQVQDGSYKDTSGYSSDSEYRYTSVVALAGFLWLAWDSRSHSTSRFSDGTTNTSDSRSKSTTTRIYDLSGRLFPLEVGNSVSFKTDSIFEDEDGKITRNPHNGGPTTYEVTRVIEGREIDSRLSCRVFVIEYSDRGENNYRYWSETYFSEELGIDVGQRWKSSSEYDGKVTTTEGSTTLVDFERLD